MDRVQKDLLFAKTYGSQKKIEEFLGKDRSFVKERDKFLARYSELRKLNERRNKMNKLSETVEMMNSEDYKERFKAEYYQLKIRYEGLKKNAG